MTQTTGATLRIGCVHRDLDFPYWATFAQGINAAVAELGVELCLPSIDAQEDWAGAAEEVAQQRPDVVILSHAVVGMFPPSIEPFLARNIPVVGAEIGPASHFASVVRADEAQGTELVLDLLFKRMGGCGKLVSIPGTHPSDRERTLQRMLKEHPTIELAFEQAGLWTRESGRRVMQAALEQHDDIRGVFAHNDHMAVGAAEVIAEYGLSDQITVVGFDADPEGLIGVCEGQLAATVYRGLYKVGKLTLQRAVEVARGESVEPELLVPTTLITVDNLVEATLDTTYLLPGLLRDLISSSKAQRMLQQRTIDMQRTIIRELSTPILPISDSILIMPLVGAIDSSRAQQIMDAILQGISRYKAQYMIIDITGISMIDTQIAYHLIQAAQAIKLLGAQALLVGISPDVAHALTGLGIELHGLITRSTLQEGFLYAQRRLQRSAARLTG